jgi:hypothetical protein
MALKTKKTTTKEPARRRTRAHNADGSFKADDPTTPDVNEAFTVEVPDMNEALREQQRSKPPGVKSSYRRLGGKLIET